MPSRCACSNHGAGFEGETGCNQTRSSPVLELAEEEGYTSIAFPAMGLGAGKLHPEVSAAAMLQPMLEMLPESSTIHEIRFCFLDESIKETFHQTLLEVFSSH